MNIQFISHLISNIGCSAMIAFFFIKIDRANIIIKSKAKTKKDIIKEIKKLISNPKIEFVEDSSFYKEGYRIELYD